jgi:hypothetical protein
MTQEFLEIGKESSSPFSSKHAEGIQLRWSLVLWIRAFCFGAETSGDSRQLSETPEFYTTGPKDMGN